MTSEVLNCSECNNQIPSRLHINGRANDPIFKDGELLFRRAGRDRNTQSRETIIENIDAWFGKKLNEASVNRSAYSEAQDVLYDVHGKEDFSKRPIFAFSHEVIGKMKLKAENEDGVYTFSIIHKEETCMYPHSQFVTYRDGEIAKEPMSRNVEILLREFIGDNCQVILAGD